MKTVLTVIVDNIGSDNGKGEWGLSILIQLIVQKNVHTIS